MTKYKITQEVTRKFGMVSALDTPERIEHVTHVWHETVTNPKQKSPYVQTGGAFVYPGEGLPKFYEERGEYTYEVVG